MKTSLKTLACSAGLIAGLGGAGAAHAGPYADDMAKCLVRSSTPADRTTFVQFMFIALAQHPDVKMLVSIPQAQMQKSAKATGQLFQRLMMEACKNETQAALRYEGVQTVSYAFQSFGQTASSDLFQNAQVAATFREANKYIDADKLKALLSSGAAPDAPANASPGPR